MEQPEPERMAQQERIEMNAKNKKTKSTPATLRWLIRQGLYAAQPTTPNYTITITCLNNHDLTGLTLVDVDDYMINGEYRCVDCEEA